jgi:hypothetical protein
MLTSLLQFVDFKKVAKNEIRNELLRRFLESINMTQNNKDWDVYFETIFNHRIELYNLSSSLNGRIAVPTTLQLQIK